MAMSVAKIGSSTFILANTELMAPPHVPEIRLHLAHEAHDLWHRTEEDLQEIGLQPPYWAFAWAGGQGLARHILDNPQIVAGKRVLDLATGSGLVAIAAAMAGAARVSASDIDAYCEAALALNAAANNVGIAFSNADLLALSPACADVWDVVLAGDVFYDAAMARQVSAWFSAIAAPGRTILVGDPGRAYLPRHLLIERAVYQVAVTRALEDSDVKRTVVWEFAGEPAAGATPAALA